MEIDQRSLALGTKPLNTHSNMLPRTKEIKARSGCWADGINKNNANDIVIHF